MLLCVLCCCVLSWMLTLCVSQVLEELCVLCCVVVLDLNVVCVPGSGRVVRVVVCIVLLCVVLDVNPVCVSDSGGVVSEEQLGSAGLSAPLGHRPGPETAVPLQDLHPPVPQPVRVYISYISIFINSFIFKGSPSFFW